MQLTCSKIPERGKNSLQKVWYNLHIFLSASCWPNVNLLCLCELVFSLPFSNGEVEQFLSSIKTTNRTSLSVSTLDDLLEIFVEGPPLDCFSAQNQLWNFGGAAAVQLGGWVSGSQKAVQTKK